MAGAWIKAGLIGLGVALTGAAAAQSKLPFDARISANAPADWQPSAGLEVRPGEPGDLHSRIADSFTGAVRARGWDEADAPAVLVFRYGVQAAPDPNRGPIELRGGLGSASDDEAEVLLRLDLKRRGDGPPPTSERIMAVTVSDRRNRVLWQAQVSASVGKDGDLALAEAMVPRVLDYLGKDAFDEPLR